MMSVKLRSLSKKTGDESLKIFQSSKSVTLTPTDVILNNCKLNFTPSMINTQITVKPNALEYKYKNNKYSLKIKNGSFEKCGDSIVCYDTCATITPSKY